MLRFAVSHRPPVVTLARRMLGTEGAKEAVGFIGLGNMGFHMASNLMKAGHKLFVFDVSSDPVQKLVQNGAVAARCPKEVAENTKKIITMLPSSPHVQQVYLGEDGIAKASGVAGTLAIDASTIDPSVARDVAQELLAHNVTLIDAPVSGGVMGAANGTLTFMVGGPDAAVEQARALLSLMGQKIVHCGPNGNGQVVKVCNNLALAIEMIGISEAMNLGVSLGMDAKLMASIFNTSTSRCWSSDTYNPVPGVMENVPASRNYEGGFGVDLMAKDLSLAVAAAHKARAPIALGSTALQIYNLISQHGKGKKDFGYVYSFLNNDAALKK